MSETILVLALIFCISFLPMKLMMHTQGRAPAASIQRQKGGTHNVTVCLFWLGFQRGVGAKKHLIAASTGSDKLKELL